MDRFNWARSSIVLSGGALAISVLGGCGKAPAGPTQAADVQVVPVEQRDVPVVRQWVGTLDGFVNAQIRAQVSGYLVKQVYKRGLRREEGRRPL